MAILVSLQGVKAQGSKEKRVPASGRSPRLAASDSASLQADLRHVPSDVLEGYKGTEAAGPSTCIFGPTPSFPGDLIAFLSKNLQYPEAARSADIEGRVVIRFLVRKDGSLDSAQVIRPLHPLLDSAALDMLRHMPAWNPGTLAGRPVDTWFKLPITFRLD